MSNRRGRDRNARAAIVRVAATTTRSRNIHKSSNRNINKSSNINRNKIASTLWFNMSV